MKHVEAVSDESGSEQFNLHTVGSSMATLIMVSMDVDGRDLEMELDTGAAFSVISEGSLYTSS